MNKLLNMLKERIDNGTDVPCITGNVLKDPEVKLNDGESDTYTRCVGVLLLTTAQRR